jgi:hypothetical protein
VSIADSAAIAATSEIDVTITAVGFKVYTCVVIEVVVNRLVCVLVVVN